MSRRPARLVLVPAVVLAALVAAGLSGATAPASAVPVGAAAPVETAAASTGGGAPYQEPVVLSSSGGVLEVTLTTRQGTATIDTAAGPVRNALLFGYRIERGTSSDGRASATDLYPGPTLNVQPGETLIVHLDNALSGLTIRDYSDPAFTPAGMPVPLYPHQLASSPYNNHTHGLHVSPSGNSDNVLLNIPPGKSNTYTYAIPTDHPQGLYWYHSHRHMLTTQQVYRGLVGMLVIGRADGGIPAVTQSNIPVRTMALQYNYVFNRAGGSTVLNNSFWPANVSTLKKASAAELARGTYEPKLTPINFRDSAVGTRYLTAWYDGPLSVNNNRGVFQYLPTNLQSFTSTDTKVRVPANPSLPDGQRDLQYTVNGQFEPVVSTPPGQMEIWVLGNFTESAYLRVAVTNTATGARVPLAIVGQDGNPYTTVSTPSTEGGTTLLIPPASRYAVAVTMPSVGGLRLEMPSWQGQGPTTTSNPGILYTNNGTPNSPAVTGTINVDPTSISYMDGFFVYPTQTLLTVQPSAGTGTTAPLAIGQPTGAYTSFDDLSGVKPDVSRTLYISGGFDNHHSNMNDPNTFAYQFDGNQFPNIPLLQPRLGSTEQWNFVNTNNDQHPIHIHVNDFQVVTYDDPVAKVHLTNLPWGQDNQNTPAPLYNASGSSVVTPGRMSLRTRFKEFIGAYVLHCHRLNHEDNGLMALINVIPAVTGYAVALPGAGARPTRVQVRDQATRRVLATVAPFGRSTAPVDVAMGDVNGDMILDLIVGSGKGAAPRVKAYSGARDASGRAFRTVLVDTPVFSPGFRGGVSVASAGIDGTQRGDSIIVGSGPGMRATVSVLASGVEGGRPFATWHPYGSFTGGVNVAAGLVEASGRSSVITAPGAGMSPRVHTYVFDLFAKNGSTSPSHVPSLTSSFLAFESGYTGGVSVATGWVAGKEGGFSRILVGKQSGASTVAAFTSGSALTGHPMLYMMLADDYSDAATFTRSARFEAFPGSTSGVDVTTAANTRSADLVVSGTANGRRVVQAFDLYRAAADADQWSARPLYTVPAGATAGTVGGQ